MPVLVGLVLLLGALLAPRAAHAAPPEQPNWIYEFSGFTATPAATDYDHRSVALTGLLLRHRAPDGPSVPAPGETVDLAQSAAGAPSSDTSPDAGSGTSPGPGSGASSAPSAPDDTVSGPAAGGAPLATVTTDAAGRFWLQNAVVDQRADQDGAAVPGPYTVVIRAVHHTAGDPAADGTEPAGGETEARVAVTATPSVARLTVDYRLGPVSAAGRRVTALGSYRRDSGQGPRPLAGAAVRVEYQSLTSGQPLVEKAVTGSDGRFSVTFTASAAGTVSTAVDAAPDPYLDPAAADGLSRPVDVPRPRTPSAAPPSPSATLIRLDPVPLAHVAAPTRTPTLFPASGPARPTAAAKPVQPADMPNRLAVTGGGASRVAFLTGGSTLLAAGLVLMVARRRMRPAR
ncbi:hypothetical protein ACFO3J_29625 [Streptomyces polygonati]|uniref:Carboxypeptidase regulatory-like domain-containing protein n=1 Tax=Streptomyces polygonati TaxID=1617087 RepID=A0ABV8I0K1_9ACTN